VVVESLKEPLLRDIAAEASVRRAVERREQAIAARLRSRSTAPVQAGLFDRRALDAADARARSSRTFIEESEPRAADGRAPDAAEVTVRVIGVHFGTLTKR
jgi:hypothetical protein